MDLVWNSQIFSRYNHEFDKKWKVLIGNVLFKEQIHFRDFLAANRALAAQSRSRVVCYRALLVGCGQLSGLDGQALHRSASLDHIRRALWQAYAPRHGPSDEGDDAAVRVLMLEKNSSSCKSFPDDCGVAHLRRILHVSM